MLVLSCFGQTTDSSGSTGRDTPPTDGSILFASGADVFGTQPQERKSPISPARDLWQDQKDIWTSPFRVKRSDLRWLVPLAGTTAVLIATDHHTVSRIHSNPLNRSESTTFSNAGLAVLGGAAISSLALGSLTSNDHVRETGILTTEALANSFIVSEALKLISQRDRPDINSGQGLFWQHASRNSSFPSEHAALAWAAAAVIAREYPGPVTTWSAYGLASAISFSRITAGSHFPSDVLIGAVAGYMIGRHMYNAHHDDRMTDRTGSTPVEHNLKPATAVVRPRAEPRGDKTGAAGPLYVPIDSWIYPALYRLVALGYVPSQVSDAAPWTREECVRQVHEAAGIASLRQSRDGNARIQEEALRLISQLNTEFESYSNSDNVIGIESVYTRFTDIQGPPLRDSYHFGQTVTNDYGRPYGEGLNNITGFSAFAASGRFSAYVRGEYQEAPGADAYDLGTRALIGRLDGNPLLPATPIASTSRFEPLEMYAGVRWGFENITFGRQSLWWGPGQDSAFSLTNNAAPLDMLRFSQARPFVLPGPLSILGRIRTEVLFGKLSGHQWPARPFVNAQKITLDLTDNFEVGFTRSAFFGGVGHPLTLGALKDSLVSTSSIGGTDGATAAAGDRHSGFDFRWRLPGLRRYVTLYSDSYADDEPSPLDNPRRSAWGPGIYIAQIPPINKLDLRVETYATWLYRRDYGGTFIYWNNQYHDAYTNQGNLLGSWVGRDARAYVATTSYWFSAKSKVTGQYKQIKAGSQFLPGGGTQTDGNIMAQWGLTPEWMLSAKFQYERYYVPSLSGPQHDFLSSLQLTFTPHNLTFGR